MLREILYRIQQENQLEELPRPCDIFDLAGGTSTGGLIVIMLFRLRMSIDEAIDAYARLAKHVFSAQKWFFKDGKFKASRLEEAIATVIQDALKIGEGESRSVRMLDEEAVKCFVCAMPEGNFSSPFLFRSWSPVANQTYNCTIVEAARATSAAPTFFKAVEFGEPIRQRYIDGGLGCNNPVRHVIEEAKSLFPTRPISCVISLGTGAAAIIGLDRANVFQRLLRMNLIKALKGIATDCERRSEETAQDAKSFQYIRLNVDQGLQHVSLAEWEKLAEVQLHTLQYLKTHSVGQRVNRLVQVLRADTDTPSAENVSTAMPSIGQRPPLATLPATLQGTHNHSSVPTDYKSNTRKKKKKTSSQAMIMGDHIVISGGSFVQSISPVAENGGK